MKPSTHLQNQVFGWMLMAIAAFAGAIGMAVLPATWSEPRNPIGWIQTGVATGVSMGSYVTARWLMRTPEPAPPFARPTAPSRDSGSDDRFV